MIYIQKNHWSREQISQKRGRFQNIVTFLDIPVNVSIESLSLLIYGINASRICKSQRFYAESSGHDSSACTAFIPLLPDVFPGITCSITFSQYTNSFLVIFRTGIPTQSNASRFNHHREVLHITPDNYLKNRKTYDSIIEQGKSMGIYTWQCHIDSHPELLLSMAAKVPDCAFIIFCPPNAVSSDFIDHAMELDNIMLAIRYENKVESVCHTLRSRGLLYSIYYTYTPDDYKIILNDDLFYSIQQLHPVFTGLVSDSSSPRIMCETIYEHILTLRDKQILQTVPWELKYDCSLIDSIISNEPCLAEFHSDGNLCLTHSKNTDNNCNLFFQDLKTIFQTAFPKTT